MEIGLGKVTIKWNATFQIKNLKNIFNPVNLLDVLSFLKAYLTKTYTKEVKDKFLVYIDKINTIEQAKMTMNEMAKTKTLT